MPFMPTNGSISRTVRNIHPIATSFGGAKSMDGWHSPLFVWREHLITKFGAKEIGNLY